MNFWNGLFSRWRLSRQGQASEVVSPKLPDLVGRLGRALTPLRATGFIEVDGVRHEALALQGALPKDCLVRVVGKRMSWWLVERAES